MASVVPVLKARPASVVTESGSATPGAGCTLTVKLCTASGALSLVAVRAKVTLIRTGSFVSGSIARVGAVPLKTPVTESSVSQPGRPVAEKVGGGAPVAVTVKEPATPAVKMTPALLVKTGATGACTRTVMVLELALVPELLYARTR